jgi:hypothetical protein
MKYLLIRKAIKNGLSAYDVQSPRIMEQLREMQLQFNLSFEPKMVSIWKDLKKGQSSGYAIVAGRFTGKGVTGKISWKR